MFPKMFQTRVPTLILFPACVNFFVAKWYSPWCMQTSAMASKILTRSIVSIPASSLLGVSFSAKSSLISTVWSMQIFKASQYCNQKSKTMSSSSKFYCISICIAFSATQNPTILDKILYWSWNFLSVTLPWQNGSWKLNCNFWKFCFLIHSILMFVKKYKYNIHPYELAQYYKINFKNLKLRNCLDSWPFYRWRVDLPLCRTVRSPWRNHRTASVVLGPLSRQAHQI